VKITSNIESNKQKMHLFIEENDDDGTWFQLTPRFKVQKYGEKVNMHFCNSQNVGSIWG
jgi:hypothetical protein